MKRISRDPRKFDLMKVLDEHARSQGLDIRDQSIQAPLLEVLGKQIAANQSNDILIHGLRIQTMFAYVAAALGACRAIKEEDAGEFYSDESAIRPPDFRIVTLEHRELLVEVKNCHTLPPQQEYRLTATYMNSLKTYASVFKLELFVAIYWSRLALWNLLSAEDFALQGDEYVLTFERAMKRNHMSILGDCTIGTIPPLMLKIYSDATKPRALDELAARGESR